MLGADEQVHACMRRWHDRESRAEAIHENVATATPVVDANVGARVGVGFEGVVKETELWLRP